MMRTIENLMQAFIGESVARNKYTFYATIAKKEGFEKVAAVFLETAENESQHAKWLLRLIKVLAKRSDVDLGEIRIETGLNFAMGDTLENLKDAIDGEHYENSEMYPEFAKVAEDEGLEEIALRLRAIAVAEKAHEDSFKKLLALLKDDKMFRRDEEVYWVCRKCGYVHKGVEAPDVCPSCSHPQGYFQIIPEI